jgi:hypothetical protein
MYLSLIWVWTICLGLIAAAWLFLIDRRARLQAAFWAFAAVIASLPGLSLARINLLLLPTVFFGFSVATVLLAVSKRSAAAHLLAMSLALFALTSSGFGSSVMQKERAASNLNYLCSSPNWLYGNNQRATIPEERRALVKQQLAEVGIYSLEDRNERLPALVQEAMAGRRYAPNQEGLPFVPRFRFLTAPDWRNWSCIDKEGWLFW